MAKSTLNAATLAAITAAVNAALAGQQATPAPVATAPRAAKGSKTKVAFLKDDGTTVYGTQKQVQAWTNLRANSKARSAALTPEQRAASQAKRESFLAKAAERQVNKGVNRELAAALRAAKIEPNGAPWAAAKAALAKGKTVAQAVTAARKA